MRFKPLVSINQLQEGLIFRATNRWDWDTANSMWIEQMRIGLRIKDITTIEPDRASFYGSRLDGKKTDNGGTGWTLRWEYVKYYCEIEDNSPLISKSRFELIVD